MTRRYVRKGRVEKKIVTREKNLNEAEALETLLNPPPAAPSEISEFEPFEKTFSTLSDELRQNMISVLDGCTKIAMLVDELDAAAKRLPDNATEVKKAIQNYRKPYVDLISTAFKLNQNPREQNTETDTFTIEKPSLVLS